MTDDLDVFMEEAVPEEEPAVPKETEAIEEAEAVEEAPREAPADSGRRRRGRKPKVTPVESTPAQAPAAGDFDARFKAVFDGPSLDGEKHTLVRYTKDGMGRTVLVKASPVRVSEAWAVYRDCRGRDVDGFLEELAKRVGRPDAVRYVGYLELRCRTRKTRTTSAGARTTPAESRTTPAGARTTPAESRTTPAESRKNGAWLF